ncbi:MULTISPECIES: PTS sugar transporter subunit IIB [Vibrio]|uniref:Lichenan-specific phosphotransferase enzyme IIB component n=3 Tax=Vibrio TaxID=662 RepID=A0A240ELB1_9VIBR|nr:MULTISPECIES: PTS sugar transporter subunit IIB [Vibrio]ASI91661.1 PTS sugar transporter subunit IIB [Vibrio mediterranei]KFA98663.1 cytochrome C biogenesis protein CcmE [Vibrio sp. ER1A]MCF4176273.1 PTS sugar transporter subunit IIB [Vibrio sp. McD22-P3]MCG9625579.1 PTS sugar transporter subunit IIB [Vibrio mediterranei]MCG9656160.1 PTS sugar transporter subunit IIB [Vibrio mediterranei]
MKILLLCSAGMSTSILVKKMEEAAKNQSIDAEILAVPIAEFETKLADWDVFLLGPQVKFRQQEFAALAAEQGKKVLAINPMDYGAMRGEKVLATAIEALSETA